MERMSHFTDPSIADRTYPPPGGETPPRIYFTVDDDSTRMIASPPGAFIEARCTDEPDVSAVRIRSFDHGHIADIRVHAGSDSIASLTDETIAIASAIYWSWWRACEMRRQAKNATFAW